MLVIESMSSQNVASLRILRCCFPRVSCGIWNVIYVGHHKVI